MCAQRPHPELCAQTLLLSAQKGKIVLTEYLLIKKEILETQTLYDSNSDFIRFSMHIICCLL